jgi:hypothetical protein
VELYFSAPYMPSWHGQGQLYILPNINHCDPLDIKQSTITSVPGLTFAALDFLLGPVNTVCVIYIYSFCHIPVVLTLRMFFRNIDGINSEFHVKWGFLETSMALKFKIF